MSQSKKSTIEVQGTTIAILPREDGDYISLTDMVRHFDGGGALIEQWLKNKDTVLNATGLSDCSETPGTLASGRPALETRR